MGLTNSVFRWLYDTIFICSKNKNTWKLTAVRNISQTCLLNTLNLICLMLYSINSLAIIEWRHYSCNSLNAVTEIISWRSLKKNKLIYFIKYFFLKNLNVNLFMCLHIEKQTCHTCSGICQSPFTNFCFWIKTEFLNVVKCRWGSGGAVSSATGSWQSPAGGSEAKASEKSWPFYIWMTKK